MLQDVILDALAALDKAMGLCDLQRRQLGLLQSVSSVFVGRRMDTYTPGVCVRVCVCTCVCVIVCVSRHVFVLSLLHALTATYSAVCSHLLLLLGELHGEVFYAGCNLLSAILTFVQVSVYVVCVCVCVCACVRACVCV